MNLGKLQDIQKQIKREENDTNQLLGKMEGEVKELISALNNCNAEYMQQK
jgi:hypothetical protein